MHRQVYVLLSAITLLPASVLAQPFSFNAALNVGASPNSAAVVVTGGQRGLAVAKSGATNNLQILVNSGGGYSNAGGSPYTVGADPVAVAVGDVDGDGLDDVVTANKTGHNVSFLLSSTPGSIVSVPLGGNRSPVSIVLADFDGDGRLDLATANSTGNNVSVMLHNSVGNGYTEVAGSPFAVGSNATSVSAGDINGDGNLDLAVSNKASNTVSILMGNGSGGFAPGGTVTTGSQPVAVAVGDFDGDQKADLAVANSGDNSLTILLGDGTGGFFPATGSPYNIGGSPVSITSGFPGLNGTFVVAPRGDGRVAVMIPDSSGGFAQAIGSPISTLSVLTFAGTGDVDGDGKADLLVVDGTGTNLAILTNNLPTLSVNPVNITFDAAAGLPSPSTIPLSVTSQAGPPATATVHSNQPWLNAAPVSTGVGGGVSTVNAIASTSFLPAGPFSGKLRFSAPGYLGTATNVKLNITGPSATLVSSVSPTGTAPKSVAMGDFNGDGKLDIAMVAAPVSVGGYTVRIALGDGFGNFFEAGYSPIPVIHTAETVSVGDFNGDGKDDLVVVADGGASVRVFLNQNGAGFAESPDSPLSYAPFTPISLPVGITTQAGWIQIADFNADGKADVAAYTGSGVTLFLGNGLGRLKVSTPPGLTGCSGGGAVSMTAADVNGDGRPDFIFSNTSPTPFCVLASTPIGTYAVKPIAPPFSSFTGDGGMAAADFNHDGLIDLAVVSRISIVPGSFELGIFLGDGAGGFSPAPGSPYDFSSFAGATQLDSIAYGDFDGDGNLDLAIGGGSSGLSFRGVRILTGNGQGRFALANSAFFYVPTDQVRNVVVSDFNSDGKTDLATSILGPTAGVGSYLGTLPVQPGPPVLSTTLPSLSITAGTSVPLKVVVSVPNPNTPPFAPLDGTVTFLDGGFPMGTAPESESPFTFTANLSSGTHNIVALYQGILRTPPQIIASNSLTITVTSGLTPQTVTFPGPLPNKTYGDPPFTVSATASSSLLVTFSSLTPTVCSVTGNTVTILAGGPCGIAADQFGNFTYAAAPQVIQGFNVSKLDQTITFNPLSSKSFGDPPFIVNATASSGLTVSFSSLTASICSVTGNLVSITAIGTCTIQADQTGTPIYNAAPPVIQNFNISKGSQTITFGPLGAKQTSDPPFTVSATASSGLLVSFSSNTTSVCTVSGNTVTLVGILGTCTIQADQSGSNNFNPAPSTSRSFSVGLGSQTITFNNLPNVTLGTAPFTLSATASSALTVTFSSLTPSVCTVSGNTVTILTVGLCTVQADQAGNTLFNSAPSVQRSFSVLPGPQTITFSPLADKSLSSSPVAISATTSSGLTVTFTSTTLAVCSVTGNSVTLLTTGLCSITASQPGNSSYTAATPVTQSFNVTPALLSQTITFGPLTSQTFGAAPFSISATASSSLPVSFATNTLSICTVSGSTVTIVSVGICSITASQGGNGTYAAATAVTQTFTINPASQTINFGALGNQAMGNPPFGISASATSGLPVAFNSTTPTICTVSGSTVTLVGVGLCSITATQGGNTNYSAATPVTQNFTVDPSALTPQTITFAPLPAVPFSNSPLTVTATASSGLPVSFASTSPSSCAVSGNSVTLLTLGACTLQATQSGNGTYAAATPVSRTFRILIGSQTITFAPLADRALGSGTFNLTATASSGLPVSYVSNSPSFCTVSGSTVTLVATGLCSITASQAGNSTFDAATPVTRTFNVTQLSGQSQTISFGPLSNQTFGVAPFSISATASSGLPVSFASNTPGVCTASGSTITILSGGNCSITASQAGNGTYSAATPVTQSFTVNPASQTINFGALSNQTFGAAPFSISATATSGLPVSFASTTLAVCTVSGNTVTLAGAGNCSITATQAGNANYSAAAPVTRSFTVNPASQSINFGALSNQTIGAAPFSISATATSGLPVSFASTTTGICTVSGNTVTLVATGLCSITATQAGNANYSAATPVSQSFTVNPAAGAPVITSVSPSPVHAGLGAQTMTISGTGFVQGAGFKVTLTDANSVVTTFQGGSILSASATQIQITINPVTSSAIYRVQVTNSGAAVSNIVSVRIVQ